MPFKRSFFNPALFKKNMSRSWPLWGGVTALGALFPLYMLLAVISGEKIYLERADFVTVLYNAAADFLPAFTVCYALLVAMFVWSYLHNSRSVGMMHSLPVSRDTIFVTNTLSGLAMLLIPYMLVGGFLCIFALFYGAMDVGAVALTIAAVLLDNLLFFGMATLCAMITGNIFAVAGYYAVLNFIAPALDLLLNSLAQEFIFGLTSEVSELSLYFAPVAGLYNGVEAVWHYTEDNTMLPPTLEGFWLIAVYGLVGLLMLAAAWALYRARRSESAGDVVAFRALRPVFRFGIAILSALTLGRLAYEIFWATLFQRSDYADLVPMLVCMAITAIVGYYIASMLLEKTLRVFKGSLKGVAVVCVATVVIGVVVSLDLFGVESYVPNAEDIQTVDIWGVVDINYWEEMHNLSLCEKATDLHRAIAEDKDYILSFGDRYSWLGDGGETVWTNIRFSYTLKNGSMLERSYVLPVSLARMSDPGTYDAKMKAIVEDPEAIIATVTIPEGAELSYAGLDGYNSLTGEWENWGIGSADFEEIYAALLRDAAEGNFLMDSSFYYMWDADLGIVPNKEDFGRDVILNIEYRIVESGDRTDYGNIWLSLQPSMEHTLSALVDAGVITREIIDGWTN